MEERLRISEIGSPQIKKEDIFGMTSTSFMTDKQNHKLDHVRKQ
jgi:hypothetical protein